MTCRLSVLVAAYDARDYIAQALSSVFAQGLDGVEVVVVDDGSDDGTADIVERLAAEAPPGVIVRLIRKTRNEGLAAARNTALAEARGDVVVLLDADDAFAPGALTTLFDRLESDPQARLVFPLYRWMDEDGRDLDFTSPAPAGPVGVSAIMLDNPIHSDTGVMTRRRDLEEVGAFDTRLTGYIGADMWLRFAIRHGDGSQVFEPSAAVRYRRHDTQITANWRRMDRNWTALLAKLDDEAANAIAPVRSKAVARHKLFCSALAYKAGEYWAARRLLASAIAAEPLLLVNSATARTRFLACAASLLPPPLHRALRERFG